VVQGWQFNQDKKLLNDHVDLCCRGCILYAISCSLSNYSTCSTTKWTCLVVRAEIAVDAVLVMDTYLRVPAFVVPNSRLSLSPLPCAQADRTMSSVPERQRNHENGLARIVPHGRAILEMCVGKRAALFTTLPTSETDMSIKKLRPAVQERAISMSALMRQFIIVDALSLFLSSFKVVQLYICPYRHVRSIQRERDPPQSR
jgi:hypothetical protein